MGVSVRRDVSTHNGTLEQAWYKSGWVRWLLQPVVHRIVQDELAATGQRTFAPVDPETLPSRVAPTGTHSPLVNVDPAQYQRMATQAETLPQDAMNTFRLLQDLAAGNVRLVREFSVAHSSALHREYALERGGIVVVAETNRVERLYTRSLRPVGVDEGGESAVLGPMVFFRDMQNGRDMVAIRDDKVSTAYMDPVSLRDTVLEDQWVNLAASLRVNAAYHDDHTRYLQWLESHARAGVPSTNL